MDYDADLNSGRQDGFCELSHIDAQEVTDFLCSWGGETRAVTLERAGRQCVREEAIVVCLCQ